MPNIDVDGDDHDGGKVHSSASYSASSSRSWQYGKWIRATMAQIITACSSLKWQNGGSVLACQNGIN